MSQFPGRGFAVLSATAVTTVGAVAGITDAASAHDTAAAVTGTTLLSDVLMDAQARVQTTSLLQQADAQAVAADSTARKTAEEAARRQAAHDAIARHKAAEEVEAEREAQKREENQAADRSGTRETSAPTAQSSYTVGQVQAIAQGIVPGGQYQCFSNIVEHESGWNYQAVNASSGAYGLVQALPGSKMSSAGADWRTNPATQIKWGLGYMNQSYRSPCGAWKFWQANHWY